jgi:DNA-binding IclR family transcriptional regulator
MTAAGKAILAHLPTPRRNEILRQTEFERRTEHTITDSRQMREHLESVRERGYACSDEEEIKGIRAVGAPIFDYTGECLGSVSVSAPTSYFTDEIFTEEIPALVMEAVNMIELEINMSRSYQ